MNNKNTGLGWLFLVGFLFMQGCSVSVFDDEDDELREHAQRVGRVIDGAGVQKSKPDWMLSKGEGIYKLGKPYKVNGVWYFPKEDYKYDEIGVASWYGPGFHTKTTANGEVFDMEMVSAAHKTLPLPCVVRVTNLENGRSILLRVNDRGPFVNDRIIDLSRKAADLLGMLSKGTSKVRVELMPEESMTVASLAQNKVYLKSQKTNAAAQATAGMVQIDGGATPGQSMMGSVQDKPLIPEGFSAVSAPGMGLETMATNLGDKATVAIDTTVTETAPASSMAEFSDQIETSMRPTQEAYTPPSGVPVSSAYVQAGAFGSVENAKRIASKLSHVAEAKIHPMDVNGRTVYRVRFGPYDDVGHAQKVHDSIVKSGHSDVNVVMQ